MTWTTFASVDTSGSDAADASPNQQPETHAQTTARVGRRMMTGASLVALVAFVYVNRRDIGAFAMSLRSASPAWILTSVIVAFAGVTFGYAGAHRVAISASGVPIRFRAGIRLGLRAFAMNTLVKSGGLAGIVPYLRHAERHNSSTSRTRTGYLLANILGDVAIAVTLLCAIAVLAVTHHLSRTIVAASVVFAVYLLSVAVMVGAAARSRDSVRQLHALPATVGAYIRRRGHVPPDHRAADEMYAAITQLRARPLALAPAVGWALMVDMAGVVTLLLVMKAFGQPVRFSVAVSAYAISMLFALVSFLPGGLGFAELSLAGVLVSFGVPAPIAAAIAVTDRVAETWIPSAVGLLIRAPRPDHGIRADSRPEHRALRRNRRLTAGAVVGLGFVELWLAATRRPIIDSSAIALDRAAEPCATRAICCWRAHLRYSSPPEDWPADHDVPGP